MTDRFREQGAFSWFELTTDDVAAAQSFYGRLFGWSMERWDGEVDYTLIKVGAREVAGIAAAGPGHRKPPGWGVYVTVTDVDQTAARAEELGGRVLVPPTDIPRVGRFCVLQDPQGAVLTAITYCRP
ncbi:VOC family protein [Geomonas subterranea]|uniref:VOC family protein n=1 Tax=Geomonas subterranea TaxID=2847989 RepID=A0ABX8LPM5_9BACT|nr:MULTISPECIES: VOC family protein [Geomonas]QXE92198.1 VOC family protein [Geomonas subterranea]QXM09703.1 VOC family protein [Geomonas subterranea]